MTSAKRRGLLAGLAGAVLVAPGAHGPAHAQGTDRQAMIDTLMALERQGWQLVKERNVEAARAYFSDDALLIFSDGSRYTKAEFLKLMPDFRLDSLEIAANPGVRIWSTELATLLYRATYTSALKGAPATIAKTLSSSTYVRRDGRWLSAFYQETPTA